jgi:hypothetical protein
MQSLVCTLVAHKPHKTHFMTARLNLRLLLLALFAMTTFAGCDKIDEEIDKAITKHVILSYETENTPYLVNVHLSDMTIGSITMDPSYPDKKSGDITIADNMPYTLNIKTSPMTDVYNVTTTPYTGSIPDSMFNASQNKINVKIDNLVPTVYVNDVKVTTSNNGGGNGGGGNGGGSGIDTLYSQLITGKMYERKIIRFNVPSGTKTLTVKVTEFDQNTDRNMADLFVRKGNDPIVNHNPPQNYDYTWTADCSSINPNRADELCKFDNPASGQWSVLLYGYNADFDSRLIITTTK